MHVERIPIENRDQWLGLRRKDVTASDIGAACGVDPRKSRLRLYLEKTGGSDPIADNPIMRRGRWLEPAIMAALADERPSWRVEKATYYLRDPGNRIGATPDFIAHDDDRGPGIIQGKIVAKPVWNDIWQQGDEIAAPLYYQLQTLTEAKLEGAAWAALAVLVVDTFNADLHVVPVDIHEGAWERVRASVATFWSDINIGKEPLPSPEHDHDLVRRLYREDDGTTVDLTGDNRLPELLDEREMLKARVNVDKKRLDKIDTDIRAKLGASTFATIPGWRITCKVEPRTGYTVEPTAPRVLRIKRSL